MIFVERKAGPLAPDNGGDSEARPGASRLSFPGVRHPGWHLDVHYRNDERSQFLLLPDGWLYVSTPVGLECFPDIGDILARAPASGIAASLDVLEHIRPCAFVAWFKDSEELQFGRSLDGFASLYFGGELPRLVIAESNLEVARRLGPVRFSERDEGEWFATGKVRLEGSFLEGAARCLAGVRYRAPLTRRMVMRGLMVPAADPLDQRSAVALMRSELRRTFATYGNRRIALRLSGGVDSRLILAGLVDALREGILHRDQVLLVSAVFPGFDCDESEPIRDLVRITGLEWIAIEVTRERAAVAYRESLQFLMPPFPTTFIGILCIDEAVKRGAELVLGGHGGDELFDFDLGDVLARPQRERLRSLPLIRWFRSTRTPVGQIKALAQALFGHRSLRDEGAFVRGFGLGGASAQACHRLGRRLALARNVGYELMAAAAANRGICLDVPIFRARLWSRLDPLAYHHYGTGDYKSVAWAYMNEVVAAFAGVEARKVAFDAAVASLGATSFTKCDAVDTFAVRVHDSRSWLREWQAQFQLGGKAWHRITQRA